MGILKCCHGFRKDSIVCLESKVSAFFKRRKNEISEIVKVIKRFLQLWWQGICARAKLV